MSNYFDATGTFSILVVFVSFLFGVKLVQSSVVGVAALTSYAFVVVTYLLANCIYFSAPIRRSSSSAILYSCIFVLYSISCVSISVEFVEYYHKLNVTRVLEVIELGAIPSFNVFPHDVEMAWYRQTVAAVLFFVAIYETYGASTPFKTGLKIGALAAVWGMVLPVFSWYQVVLYSVSSINVLIVYRKFHYNRTFSNFVVSVVSTIYSLIDEFHYGCLEFDPVTCVGAITLPTRCERWGSVEVRDRNKLRNAGVWRHIKTRRRGSLTRMAGHTMVGGVVLPYPVACDPAALLRFRDAASRDITKWRMFVTGNYDFDILDPSPLFHLYDAVSVTASLSWLSPSAWISQVLMIFLFDIKGLALHNLGGHVTYVIVEEIFNEVSRFPIWIVEATQAYSKGGWTGVAVKTFVHGTLQIIPFPLRVVLHCLWNNALLTLSGEGVISGLDARVAVGAITDDQAEMILGGSQAAKVALMLVKREWTLLGIELLQYVVQHREYFGSWEVGSLGPALETVFNGLVAKEEAAAQELHVRTLGLSGPATEVYMLSGEDDPRMSKLSLLFSWLPANVSRSPAIASSIALLTAYGLSLDPKELSWAGRLLRDVVFPRADIDNAHSLMRHAATVITSLYSAIIKCGTTGEKLQAFLGVSKPVKFMRESTALQTNVPYSMADCDDWLARADEFIQEWSGESARLPPGMESSYASVLRKYAEVKRQRVEMHVGSLLIKWSEMNPSTSAEVRNQLIVGKEIREFVKKELDNQLPFRMVGQYEKFCSDYRLLKAATGPISRPQPMSIMMMGEPGVGKTFGLQSIMVACVPQFNRLLEHYGLPLTDASQAPRSVTNVSLEKKHMLSGNVYGGNLCILANDMPSNTTPSEKSDKADLAVHLQQCLDTAPLTMTAPEIAQKRVAHVPLILYNTANHMEFVCAGETVKLVRRMDGSVMLYCCYGDPAAPIPVERLAGKSDAEKRELMRFTVCTFHAEGKRFWFKKTAVTFGYSHLTAFVLSKFKAHVDEQIRKSTLYGENVPRCACGKTYHDHFFKKDKGVEEFRTIAGLCTMKLDVLESPSTIEISDTFGNHVDSVRLGTGFVFGPVDFVAHVFAWLISFVFVMTILERGRIGAFLERYALENSNKLAKKLMLIGDRYPVIMAALTFPAPESNRLVIKAYATACARFEAFKERLHKALLPLIAIGATAALVSAVVWRKPETAGETPSRARVEELAVKHVTKDDRLAIVPRLETAAPETEKDKLRDYEGLVSSVKKAGWKSPEWTASLPTFKTYGGSAADVIALAKKTTLPAYFSWEGRERPLFVLLVWVCPTWIGFNQHFIREVPSGVDVTIRHEGGHEGSLPFVATFRREDCISYPGSEFFFINVLPATFPASKSQLKFWCTKPGDQAVTIVYPIEATGVITRRTLISGGPEYLTVAFRGNLEKGTCGTPVVVVQEVGPHKGSHFIIGHVFAREDRVQGSIVYASVACQDEFERVAGGIAPKGVLYDMTVLPVDPLPMVSQLNGIHPDTPVVALGSDGRNDSTFKSAIKPTVALPFVIKHFEEEMDVPSPAHVKGVMIDGVFKSPVTHATEASGHLPSNARPSEWKSAVDHLVPPVVNKYRESFGDKDLRPLTMTEALIGIDGFIDKVDMKKSVGPFFRSEGCTSRLDVFDPVDPEEVDEEIVDAATMKLTPLGEERCMTILETIDNEELFCSVNEWKYKDEVRPVSKLAVGKVRLFCVNDFAFGLLARAYLLPLLAIWLKYPEVSECYGAMNAGGPEAEKLYQRLARHPNSFDGDFRVFDGSHASLGFLSVTEGVYKLAKGLGYTDVEARRAAYFILSAAYCVLKFGKDYVLKAFGFPSGHIATLFFNSFVNSILMRMVFLRTVGDLKYFHEHIVTANVGDDNASSVSDSVASKFNMLTFIDEVAKLGYAATPAKKGDALVKFISRDEVVFLKRSWVDHPLTGCHVLALAKPSIWKAFGWHSTQSVITPREKIMQVSRGAQIEAWLHGPEYFREFQIELSDMFDKIGYPPPILFSSDELLDRWKLNELRSWAM